jgi:signal transduction histidine kinase
MNGGPTDPILLRRRHEAHRFLAHEVRGALNTASLHLSLLREVVGEDGAEGRDERLRRSIEVLSRQQAELQRSLADLIDFSRPASGETSAFDLRAVCRDAARLACRTALGYPEPALDLPATPVLVTDDRDAVRQTILEAILHALDAAGARVHMRLVSDGRAAHLVVLARPQDGAAPPEPEGASGAESLEWPVRPPTEEAGTCPAFS